MLSYREIFLPVSKNRWRKAQISEKASWDLPMNLPTKESLNIILQHYQPDQKYLLDTAERLLEIDLEKEMKNRILIDLASGALPYSAIYKSPKLKWAVDPASYPDWVVEFNKNLGMKMICTPGESANFPKYRKGEEFFVIALNAFQHFQSIPNTLKNLSDNLGPHSLLLIDFIDVPADSAHPQIISQRRIEKLLDNHNYEIKKMCTSHIKHNGIHYGRGKPAKIVMGLVDFRPH